MMAMVRSLVLIVVFLGLAGPASAQVFKPRGSGSTTTTTTPSRKKPTSHKSGHKPAHHSSHASSHASSHKIAARRKPHHKRVDPDYVKITDDPEDE